MFAYEYACLFVQENQSYNLAMFAIVCNYKVFTSDFQFAYLWLQYIHAKS